MKSIRLQSTKIPFLLYFMRDDKAKIVKSEESVNIQYEDRKVNVEKMNNIFIFMLKHFLPVLYIYSIFNIDLFTSINNLIVPLFISSVLLPSVYIFLYKRHYILFYIVGILGILFIIASYYPQYVVDVNYSFSIIAFMMFLGFISFDMFVTYKYFNYFYVKDVTYNLKYTLAPMKFNLGFWKFKKTIYIKKTHTKVADVKLTGVFLKVPKEIDWRSVDDE